jgi:ADP-ribose pyrophosphatase
VHAGDQVALTKPDLEEEFVSGEEAYSGGFLHVRRDKVRLPDGTLSEREYIRHPGAVAILALTEAGQVVLERQFRYPLARVFIEIPAGKVEPGEDLLETAKRELLEETGYWASDWRRMTTIHNAIGYSDESIEIYLARDLEMRSPKLDAGEFLEVFTASVEEGLAMVRDGRITDVKTMIALFWLEAFPAGESG